VCRVGFSWSINRDEFSTKRIKCDCPCEPIKCFLALGYEATTDLHLLAGNEATTDLHLDLLVIMGMGMGMIPGRVSQCPCIR
jgi:hypothetical protein